MAKINEVKKRREQEAIREASPNIAIHVFQRTFLETGSWLE